MTDVLKVVFATLAVIALSDSVLRYYSALRGDLVARLTEVAAAGVYRGDHYHPILSYTSVPSFRGFVPLIEPKKVFFVETNAHGFRTREFFPKADGIVRILIIGDSFVWGYNANQDETLARVIESLFHADGQDHVEVLALGVSSYSGVRYAALSSIYFPYLKPDVIIVALDQSDFEEDLSRAKEYTYSREGCPVRLKEDEKKKSSALDRIAFDERGNIVNIPRFTIDTRLRVASGLYSYFAERYADKKEKTLNIDKVRSKDGDLIAITEFAERKPILYEDLVQTYGKDSFLDDKIIPGEIKRDVIPVSIETAKTLYNDTLNSMRCVKKEADKLGARMFLSDYPYPYFVSTSEALGRQIQIGLTAPLDFRNDRTYPMLVQYFAEQLSVGYLDGYAVIEKNPAGKYGVFDPHFSAAGYRTYATFLFNMIKKDVQELELRP